MRLAPLALVALLFASLGLVAAETAQGCPPAMTSGGAGMPGGWSQNTDVDKALSIVERAWSQMLTSCAELGSAPFDASSIQVCSFTQQVVAGMNYRVTFVFNGLTYNLKAFQPLPHTNLPLQVESCSAEETS